MKLTVEIRADVPSGKLLLRLPLECSEGMLAEEAAMHIARTLFRAYGTVYHSKDEQEKSNDGIHST